jgi:hypothetical protein
VLAALVGVRMFSVTVEDSGPTTAETLSWSSLVMLELPMALWSPSLESWEISLAGLPLTPPAALMSSTAAPTPATAGGARNDSEPVSGRNDPSVNCAGPEVGVAGVLDEVAGALVVLLEELADPPPDELHAASSSAAAATPAMPATRVLLRRKTLFRVLTIRGNPFSDGGDGRRKPRGLHAFAPSTYRIHILFRC